MLLYFSFEYAANIQQILNVPKKIYIKKYHKNINN